MRKGSARRAPSSTSSSTAFPLSTGAYSMSGPGPACSASVRTQARTTTNMSGTTSSSSPASADAITFSFIFSKPLALPSMLVHSLTGGSEQTARPSLPQLPPNPSSHPMHSSSSSPSSDSCVNTATLASILPAVPVQPPAVLQVLTMPPGGFDLAVKIHSCLDSQFLSPVRTSSTKRPMLPTPPRKTRTNSPLNSDDDSFDDEPIKKKQRKSASIPFPVLSAPSSSVPSTTIHSRRTSVDSLSDLTAPECHRLSSPEEDAMSTFEEVSNITTKQPKKQASNKRQVDDDSEGDRENYESAQATTSKKSGGAQATQNQSQHVFVLPPGMSPAKPGICHFCKSSKTGQWRRGPGGMRTLCNACGINWCRKVRAYAKSKSISVEAAEAVVGVDESWFRRVI
ncbi:hypothetical protein HDU99_006157 [Rhizoclosmatium hyalinum]|nr:hypothetical protein HDU99_006157 [Rhizoclosmatium hyalinum]